MTLASSPYGIVAFSNGEPALIGENMTERVNACLRGAVTHPDYAGTVTAAQGLGDDFWPSPDDAWGNRVRPYVIKDGVLQIPVKGVLLHNFPYALGSWATGYSYIEKAFQRGCGDFATGVIKGIALIEDTPGGMVAGCFDAVDKMVALKELTKVPVRAFAHESAYSAGYAIATVADHIVVSRTGGVGSIGVVTSHIDLSGAMEQAGVKITFIASDPSKVEGNPYETLSEDAKERIQTRIDELYGIFVAAVSRSRGLSAETIQGDLRAYCYTATQATSNGLADSIGSLDDAVAAFNSDLDDNYGEEDMTNQTNTVAQARAEGATAMQERIGAILTCDEAKDRGDLANHIAFKTSMSVDDAKGMLAVAPSGDSSMAAEPRNFFAEVMNRGGTSGVYSDVGSDGKKDDANSADPVLAIIHGAGLAGFGATLDGSRSR